MVKSGLIIGAIAFLLAIALGATISPLCTICIAIFAGLGAGYLAGVFDKPMNQGDSTKAGAGAGAIAMGLQLLGGLIAGVINAFLLPNTGYLDMMRQFGVETSPNMVWVGQIGGACCAGIFNLALGAGLGALGGILWWSMTGKNSSPTVPPSYPPSSYNPPQ